MFLCSLPDSWNVEVMVISNASIRALKFNDFVSIVMNNEFMSTTMESSFIEAMPLVKGKRLDRDKSIIGRSFG